MALPRGAVGCESRGGEVAWIPFVGDFRLEQMLLLHENGLPNQRGVALAEIAALIGGKTFNENARPVGVAGDGEVRVVEELQDVVDHGQRVSVFGHLAVDVGGGKIASAILSNCRNKAAQAGLGVTGTRRRDKDDVAPQSVAVRGESFRQLQHDRRLERLERAVRIVGED